MEYKGNWGNYMLIKAAIIRAIIPFVIMTGISLLMRYQEIDATQVRSTFFVGLIVTVVAAATVIYDIEGWSLLQKSVVHFIVMLLTVFPLLLLSGMFSLNGFLDYLKVFGLFLAVGAVAWTVSYFIIRRFG